MVLLERDWVRVLEHVFAMDGEVKRTWKYGDAESYSGAEKHAPNPFPLGRFSAPTLPTYD